MAWIFLSAICLSTFVDPSDYFFWHWPEWKETTTVKLKSCGPFLSPKHATLQAWQMRPAPLRPAQEVGRPSLPHSSWSRTVTFSSRQISLLPVRVLLVRPVAASRCLRLPEMTSDTQKITRCIGCWNSHFSKSIWAQSGDVLLSIFVLHCMKH